MKLLISTLSLFIFSNALAVNTPPAETRARIVCSYMFDGKEDGMLVVLEQTSTLYNEGSEVKNMQGEEFVNEDFDGRSPILEARLTYIDGVLGDNPQQADVDALIRNATPTFERFGQMGRISDSIRYSYGHNGTGAEKVTFRVSTLEINHGLVRETRDGKEFPRKVKCMKPYAVDAPVQPVEEGSDDGVVIMASES